MCNDRSQLCIKTLSIERYFNRENSKDLRWNEIRFLPLNIKNGTPVEHLVLTANKQNIIFYCNTFFFYAQ